MVCHLIARFAEIDSPRAKYVILLGHAQDTENLNYISEIASDQGLISKTIRYVSENQFPKFLFCGAFLRRQHCPKHILTYL